MKLLKYTFLFVLMFTLNAAAELDAPIHIDGAVTVTPGEIFQHLEARPEMVFIDTRRRVDYDRGHIKGAIQLLTSTLDRDRLKEIVPEKKTPILFYCQGPGCKRAEVGVEKALAYGYKHVFYYYGGLEDWKLHGYPLIKE